MTHPKHGLSAEREVLQVEIQIAQVESELAKALAMLERAIGRQVNEQTLAEDIRPAALPRSSQPEETPGALDRIER